MWILYLKNFKSNFKELKTLFIKHHLKVGGVLGQVKIMIKSKEPFIFLELPVW